MSPAEKVGQLFLIRFSGSNVSEGTILRELITARHIGGFVLSAESDNFSGTDTLASAYTLIAAMQSAAWEKTQHSPDTTLRGELPVYIPSTLELNNPESTLPRSCLVSAISPTR